MSVTAHRVVACVLLQDGKFLLQHRDAKADYDPNSWGFFGGHIDEGETPDAAVHREIREELQIEIEPTFIGRYAHDSPWGSVERFLYIAPLTIPLDVLRTQQQEGDDLGLFTFEEALALKLRPERVEALEDIKKFIASKGAARPHLRL